MLALKRAGRASAPACDPLLRRRGRTSMTWRVRARSRQIGACDVVAGKHGDAVVGQRLEHRAVLDSGCLGSGEELLVLALRVVHQRHRRLRQPREPGDLADMVHAELDHRGAMAGASDSSVSGTPTSLLRLPRVANAASLPTCAAQDRGDHLLDGGLAVAAGDGDQRQPEAGAPAGGDPAERLAAVRHQQCRRARPSRSSARPPPRRHRCRSHRRRNRAHRTSRP